MTPSPNAKQVFEELSRTWKSRPRVFQHWDPSEENSIHIASLDDPAGLFDVTGVGTVGLSDHDLGMGPLRVELIGAFPRSFKDAANVAATCAFNAFKDRMPTRPDTIHPRAVELYRSNTPLPHIMLGDPFLWEPDGPVTLQAAGFRIAWLMMVPIAESERLFALQNGPRALADRLEKANADVLDLTRPAVV
jgi:hypothetical protein